MIFGIPEVRGAARIGVSVIVDFYNQADFVWTVNNATAGTLRSMAIKAILRLSITGRNLRPPGTGTKGPAGQRELNLKPDELVFLYVGQLVWQKNLKTLINALALLRDMGMEYRMLMAGMGYAANDLKKMAEDLDLTDRVIFLGAVLDRKYLKSLFCRADLLLFPSVYDNASIVVQEAASQKCPPLLIRGSNTAEA